MDDDLLIAGAGIGGLALALSLHDQGIACRVFEAVPKIEPLGVGINLLPHAVRELAELGLLPGLEATGVQCENIVYVSKHGQSIWEEPRGRKAGYRWPQISIHRGRLQALLLAEVIRRLGTDRVHVGHQLTDVQSDGAGVVAAFSRTDKRGSSLSVRGRALVAADGIHSTVRKAFYPNEGRPQWNGAIMWRGVAHAPAYLDGHSMVMAGHRDQKFVCYPISHAGHRPGHHQINFIAEQRVASTELDDQQGWTRQAPIGDFLPLFEAWTFDWLDVPAMIRSAQEVWVYPMVDRDPLPGWTRGRVTLLGDAAHPMYPIGSNGASQAIVDARVMTGALMTHGVDVPAAFAHYEEIRRPATAKIVAANRQMGPELPLQLVEERAPDGFERLDDVIEHAELQRIADGYKNVAGFSVTELNDRASWTDASQWKI